MMSQEEMLTKVKVTSSVSLRGWCRHFPQLQTKTESHDRTSFTFTFVGDYCTYYFDMFYRFFLSLKCCCCCSRLDAKLQVWNSRTLPLSFLRFAMCTFSLDLHECSSRSINSKGQSYVIYAVYWAAWHWSNRRMSGETFPGFSVLQRMPRVSNHEVPRHRFRLWLWSDVTGNIHCVPVNDLYIGHAWKLGTV